MPESKRIHARERIMIPRDREGYTGYWDNSQREVMNGYRAIPSHPLTATPPANLMTFNAEDNSATMVGLHATADAWLEAPGNSGYFAAAGRPLPA